MSVLDHAVDVGELGIALCGVDDRRRDRRPTSRAEQVSDVGKDAVTSPSREPVSGVSCSALIWEQASID
jgi:hypothetical protein